MTTDDTELDEAFERILAEEVLLRHAEVAQMREALLSARQIGVAIGIVMSRAGVDRDEAFDRLVRASRNGNRKLRDLAAQVEASGELPG